ncbi:hypothetical protein [Coxiella-like endosymbiont]|uniref:hypothetical protein n=1 Tax=Coxiella-like endosymbiont TaxID=1592897 RepID=UPI00272C0E1B|nr:hypothetical protein [Coxiella-like endosymbiont]
MAVLSLVAPVEVDGEFALGTSRAGSLPTLAGIDCDFDVGSEKVSHPKMRRWKEPLVLAALVRGLNLSYRELPKSNPLRSYGPN